MTVKNPKKCEVCGKKSVITLGYGPHYFCEKHFISFFEARVRKTVRKYKLFKPREKLLVALSGGKDSIVVLKLIHKFYNKSNEISALIIDEGVRGYRDKLYC
jgi:GMP synthase PP-ATPase subunit